MDNFNNINNSENLRFFNFDLTSSENSNEEQMAPNTSQTFINRLLQTLTPIPNREDSSPPSTNNQFRIVDASQSSLNFANMVDSFFSTSASHETYTFLDPRGDHLELQNFFSIDPNTILSSVAYEEPPELQAPSTPHETVKKLKELLIDHLDPKFFQNLLDSSEQENEIEAINYISQIQDYNTAINTDNMEVSLHKISQLAKHLHVLIEIKMKAEIAFAKDLEERLIELQESTENTQENKALYEFLTKSLDKLGKEKEIYSQQVTSNCSTLKKEIKINQIKNFKDVLQLTRSISKCIQTILKQLSIFKNTITKLGAEVEQFNTSYCYVKSLENNEDIAKFLLSEKFQKVDIFLATLTQLESSSFSIKLLLKLFIGKEALFFDGSHDFKVKLLALTLCKYKYEIDSEDRKLVLKYLNFISMKYPNYTNSGTPVEFLELVKKQLNSDDLGQIAFTKKELLEYALALSVTSNNFQEELLNYEDLISIAPYISTLPTIDFSKAPYSNLTEKQIFNYLSEFKHTQKLFLSNYPLSKLPDFKFCIHVQISNSPNLQQLPSMPCCNSINLVNSGVKSLERNYPNLAKLMMDGNSNLHTIDINSSRFKSLKLCDNAQLKIVQITPSNNLEVVHILGSPDLQKLTPRQDMPNIKEFLCFDAQILNNPSRNLLHSPVGKLNICEDMIKDDPEAVLESIYKYSQTYGGLSPFPKVCFVKRGQRSKTIDEGGPTNQLFAQLIQNLIKQKNPCKLFFKNYNNSILPYQQDGLEDELLIILGQLLGIAGKNHHPIGNAFNTSLYQIIRLFREKDLLSLKVDSAINTKEIFHRLTKILFPEFEMICEMILSTYDEQMNLCNESESQILPKVLNKTTLYSCGQILVEYKEKLHENFLPKDFDEENAEHILSLYKKNPDEFKSHCDTSLKTKLLERDKNIFEFYRGLFLVAQGAAQILYSHESDRKVWKKKSPADLQLYIEGSLDLDLIIKSLHWNDLLKNTEDIVLMHKRDRAYEYLVSWLKICTESQQQAFLGATTGSLSLDSNSKITLHLNSEPFRYPSSSTCKKILYLPSSIEEHDFVEKMTFYIDQYIVKSEFHLA